MIENKDGIRRHTITCPNCNYEIPVRAMIGMGTLRGANTKINENRQHILDVLKKYNQPLDVRQI